MNEKLATSLIMDYYNDTLSDAHGRFKSWLHCYEAFSKNRNSQDEDTIELLSLHLAFYLASWGMYRGSSFLLQKDYLVHVPIVKMVMEPQYDNLLGISADDLTEKNNIKLIISLKNRISKAYAETKPVNDKPYNHATDTLISKILLGTLGCVPAYDQYFVKSIKKHSITVGNFNERSVRDLAGYYLKYKSYFEQVRNEISKNRVEYPPMKLIDMCFWQDGFVNGNT